VDFRLSDDDANMVALIDRVAMQQFRPSAFADRDNFQRPIETMLALGKLGILGICMPEAVGGAGRPTLSGILAIARIARACPRTGYAVLMTIAGPGMFIAEWGSESQKAKYLPPLLRGETAWTISLSEPEAGTALADRTTRATLDDNICRIFGQKPFAAPHHGTITYCCFAVSAPPPPGSAR
jgi:alkylation response protein AidB-like acyl-CoA dehydrogenase